MANTFIRVATLILCSFRFGTLAQNPQYIVPTDDATVSVGHRRQDINFGRWFDLWIASRRGSQLYQCFFKFPLRGPADAPKYVQSAKLNLFLQNSLWANSRINVLPVVGDWDERTINGLNYPQPGQNISTTYLESTRRRTWIEVDVTAAVQLARDNQQEWVSFALSYAFYRGHMYFTSKDVGFNSPHLELLEIGNPTPIAPIGPISPGTPFSPVTPIATPVFSTSSPTTSPSAYPTKSPSSRPTFYPTKSQSLSPTSSPTSSPTPPVPPTTPFSPGTPFFSPGTPITPISPVLATQSPTMRPSAYPTGSPTSRPSVSPTFSPSSRPTSRPTVSPTSFPTNSPSYSPTRTPTGSPTVTESPTAEPTTWAPSVSSEPTSLPTVSPTANPTISPTLSPSASPTFSPTMHPSQHPTASPTSSPSDNPTVAPTSSPSTSPTDSPTAPSLSPTTSPTVSPSSPTTSPSISPTLSPTRDPVYYGETESTLVSRGEDGKLVYKEYENQVGLLNAYGVPGGATNKVPDFSTAGYMEGNVPIPFVPVAGPQAIVSQPLGNLADDSFQIQAAIDYVASLPIGANGFRGAVLLKAGHYHVYQKVISIYESGIVVRGEGSGVTGGTTITYHYSEPGTPTFLFQLGTPSGHFRLTEKILINQDYVPVGALQINVTDVSSLQVGEEIAVHCEWNDQWLYDMSDMAQWGWSVGGYSGGLYGRRFITAIHGNVLTLDAPIIQPIASYYGGGYVRKMDYGGKRQHIGIENMRLLSNPDMSILDSRGNMVDENHGKYAVEVARVEHAWVRQVSAEYFWGGAISVNHWSSYVTVEDCSMKNPISRIAGGRRYSFSVDDSEFVLVQRCLSSHGRHDFVTGSTTNGPTVFVDSLSLDLYDDNGPHQRLSQGILMDSIKAEKANYYRKYPSTFNVQNRKASGSGHGWTGAQVMFWNLEGDFVCDAPNNAMNWAVGCIGPISDGPGSRSPEETPGMYQSHGTHVPDIRSLFYAQLKDRIGTASAAYHSAFLPVQKEGFIWDELEAWGGNGLFSDPLVTWHDEDAVPLAFSDQNGQSVSDPLKIGGIVRDLNLLDLGFSSQWSFKSGPGTVSFASASSLETTIEFHSHGTFELELSVTSLGSGSISHTTTLVITLHTIFG